MEGEFLLLLHPAHHTSSRPSAQLYALSSPLPRHVASIYRPPLFGRSVGWMSLAAP